MTAGAPLWWEADRATRATAFEEAILGAEGITEPAFHVKRWGAAYRRLSERLISQEGAGMPSGGLLEGRDVRMVWRLVYGFRTIETLRLIWGPTAFRGKALVEVGAGWGPAGWGAAWAGARRVDLVEHFRGPLEEGRRVWRGAPIKPKCWVGSGENPASSGVEGRWDHVVFSASLREICGRGPGSVDVAVAVLERWGGRLAPSGCLTVQEPGTRSSAGWLEMVRNRWVERGWRVVRPCTHMAPCPAQTSASDWCHFTAPLPAGRWTAALAGAAGRRVQEIHMSFLVLNLEPAAVAVPRWRVLESRARKGKFQLVVCGADGLRQLTALRRTGALRDRVKEVRSGDLVALEAAAIEARGDGDRLITKEAIERLGMLSSP